MHYIMNRGNGKNGSRRRRKRNMREYDTLIRYASAIVLFAAGILLVLAIFGAAGPIGTRVFAASYAIVGVGAFLLPIALIAVGLYAGFGRPTFAPLATSGILIICASVLAFAGLFPGARFGGIAGTWGGKALTGFFGFWGALVLLVATIIIGFAIVSDIEALVSFLAKMYLLSGNALKNCTKKMRNHSLKRSPRSSACLKPVKITDTKKVSGTSQS